jgi:hypothetical protein
MGSMSTIGRRFQATFVVVVVIAAGAVASIAKADVPSGRLIACGDVSRAAASIGHGCTTLDDALNAAAAQNFGGSTVYLMPGDYCPVTLPVAAQDITLIGVGAAGLNQGGATPTGPEAALSSFDLGSSSCNGQSSSYALAVPDHTSQFDVSLENLAFDGSTSGAATNGIYSNNAGLSLRDVLAENFASGTGLTFTASGAFVSQQLAQMDVENSAFLNNQDGVNFSVEGSIDESTIAGNTGVGLQVSGDMHLDNDTISHNGTGIDVPGLGNSVQMADSIVADNTTNDCAGTVGVGGDLESDGTNLIAPSCDTGNDVNEGNGTDIPYSGAIAAVSAENGGPTPSILPPSQAGGGSVAGLCHATGSDQREYVTTASFGPCDIGSVNTDLTTGTPVPDGGGSPLAFGQVPTNQIAEQRVEIQNTGGDLLGVSSVSTTGDSAFSIAPNGDGCTYFLLLHTENAGSCSIYLQAAPPDRTDDTGELIVQTTGGEIDIHLTVTGVAPFGAPTAVSGSPGNHSVTVSWTPPAASQPITGYDIQASDDNGTTWDDIASADASDTSATVHSLTNGQPYLFEVAAEDAFGDGPWSDPSAPVTPLAPPHSSALTAPQSVTINEGGKTTLSTTLTDTTSHTPITGASVSLLARAAGASSFTSVGTATTGATGTAAASVHPTVNTRYEWSYAGSTSHIATHTAAGLVSVAQVVHATLSVTKIKHGKAIKISGTVSPKETGDVVVTARYRPGNNKTTRIKLQRPTGANSVRFSVTYTPPKKGTVTIEVTRAATATNAAGESKPLKLKVT